MLLTTLLTNPLLGILLVLALVLSLSFHEFSHAFIADKLGDPTARYMGRVTLNPLAHLDPIGTVLLVVAGFGWGKPVQYNPANLRNPKRDAALIAFAGPAANFILALASAIVIKIVGADSFFGLFFALLVVYNISLGFFNLIPIYPLDGFRVVYGLLPLNLSYQWDQLKSYGIFLLLALVLTGGTSLIMTPVINMTMHLLGVSAL
jgi:Zn-dependent protease